MALSFDDALVACLLPLTIAFVFYRLTPSLTWSDVWSLISLSDQTVPETGPFSARNAYYSFTKYRDLAGNEARSMKRSYATIGRVHKRIGFDIGYPAKLDKLHELTQLNARVTDSIAELGKRELDTQHQWSPGLSARTDLSRVREALKHFVRDWSTEGTVERDRMFLPILDVLRHTSKNNGSAQRVLVPGSGLSRIAWDISRLGFDTTANEMSYFMVLALRFLMSPDSTSQVMQHTIHPYAHWFSHQRTNASLFRAIHFPDVLPRQDAHFHLAETDFFSLPTSEPYDYVVTLFFIDTSTNILTTLEHIHGLLRPGGYWINLGPLLWSSGGHAKLELSLEEVMLAVEAVGFKMVDASTEKGVPEWAKRRTVECEYTSDQNAMMSWIYKAEFWVAQKVG